MKRRVFVTLLGGIAAWPSAARAQQRPMPVVGLLVTTNPENWRVPMRDALRALGYAENTNYRLIFRSADGVASRLDELAAELVRLKVDVIVALQTPAALAARRATREIPIVVNMGDPVGTGLADSLARPGGNVTGFATVTQDLLGKQLELIIEMLPATRRVAALAHAPDPFSKLFVEMLQRAALAMKLTLQPIFVHRPDELDAAFDDAMRMRADAIVVQGSLPTQRTIELAMRHRLAAISDNRPFAVGGGLVSFSSSFDERNQLVAQYVVRILRGARPADLPIAQASRFELVINARTARALGLTIPATLLARADHVIE